MEEIGGTLRETRERLGLTLEEAERTIRIRASMLGALERGEFDSLPSEVQVRGFLHNYAEFLGIDPEALLRQYDVGKQPKRRRSLVARGSSQPTDKKKTKRRTRKPSWFSTDTFVIATITLGVIVVLGWGGQKLFASTGTGEDDAAAVASSADAISQPTAISTPSPAGSMLAETTQLTTDDPTATPTLILNVLDTVNLQVIAERESWVQVLVDGKEAFRGRMRAGEQSDYLGEERVELFTGNGGGIRVIFNGQNQGLMGYIGQVVIRVWTPRGGQTPTPTQTLTPTASPEMTETATPSPIIPET
jgi:cytoskeletal protein RodZ